MALDYLEELVVVRATKDAGDIHAEVGWAEAKWEKHDSCEDVVSDVVFVKLSRGYMIQDDD